MIKKLLFTFGFLLLLSTSAFAIKLGDIDIVGDLSTANARWEMLTETTVVSAITTWTVSGLEGDTDEVYKINGNIWNPLGVDCIYVAQLNGDSASNYGYQYLGGIDGVASAGRSTYAGMILTGSVSATSLNTGELIISSNPGAIATAINSHTRAIVNTTVTNIYSFGWSWNNTAEITSISVVALDANGIGENSNIQLWRRVRDV